MAIRNLISRRRTVELKGGRRFVCRPPTVATFMLALEEFPSEIGWLIDAWKEDPKSLTAERVCALLCSQAHDGRIGSVLATCVTSAGMESDEIAEACNDAGLAGSLTRAVASMTDHGRIVARPGGPEIAAAPTTRKATPPPSSPVPMSVSDLELMVFGFVRWGHDPLEVANWPFGLFQDMVHAFGAGASLHEAVDPRKARDAPSPQEDTPVANKVSKTVPIVFRGGFHGQGPEA